MCVCVWTDFMFVESLMFQLHNACCKWIHICVCTMVPYHVCLFRPPKCKMYYLEHYTHAVARLIFSHSVIEHRHHTLRNQKLVFEMTWWHCSSDHHHMVWMLLSASRWLYMAIRWMTEDAAAAARMLVKHRQFNFSVFLLLSLFYDYGNDLSSVQYASAFGSLGFFCSIWLCQIYRWYLWWARPASYCLSSDSSTCKPF